MGAELNLQCRPALQLDSDSETNLSVFIAKTASERDELFRVRYEAYLDDGAINASQSGMFSDPYDKLYTSILFGVTDSHSNVVGSLRFSVQPPMSYAQQIPMSCPELAIFPEELAALLRDDRPIASGSRFSVKPTYNDQKTVALLLLIAQAKAAKATGAKWGIATAKGGHINFYKRFLAMEPLCSPRRMPNLNYDYGLLVANLDKELDNALAIFPNQLVNKFDTKVPNWTDDVLVEISRTEGSEEWLPSL